MTMRPLRPVAMSLAIFSLGACASIVSDSKGVVTISSNPTAAQITIADQSGVEVYRGTTPASVTLDASAGYFDGQEYTVTFSKATIRPRSKWIAGSTAGTSATSCSAD
jgi:hypothetical protein